jgi:hypothetical protein
MGFVLRAAVIACVALFFVLLTLVAVEDWQTAMATVDHPEMQIRGNVYSPYEMSCKEMLAILENPQCLEYLNLRGRMRQDFDTLAAHNYNLIRIYYHPKYDETVNPCILRMPDDSMFTAMDTLLAMLDSVGLKLYVSLTGSKDWAWEGDVPSCAREAITEIVQNAKDFRYLAWLDSFLAGGRGYANDSTIVCWDLRNEGNPEDDTCNAWIDTVLPHLQSIDSTTPVTRGIGSGKPGATGAMRDSITGGDFDVYTWHPYVKTADTINDTFYVTRQWTTLPVNVDTARDSCYEHTLQFGEFGFPVYKQKDSTVDQMPEMEHRQLYRNFFYKMWELGITKANVFKMYDKVGKTSFGVYREDRSFKPAGELIAQIFSGASWDTIPIIGNWHMELDDRDNWEDCWGKDQPSCWRTKVWRGTPGHISFVWDTTKNFTPDDDSVYIGFPPRASLKIAIEPPAQVTDTCEASWYFRCCEAGEKQHTAVTPGVSYTCSAYVWFEHSLDSVGLGIRWYDVYGDTISTDHNYIPGSSLTAMQWQAIDTTLPALDSAYSCIVSCNVYSTDTCTVWFDDVQLYEALKWKTYYPDSVNIMIGDSVSGGTVDLDSDDGQYYAIGAADTLGDWWTDWYGVIKIDEEPDDVKRLWVGYDGHYSVGERNQKIYLRNWSSVPERWDILCAIDTTVGGSCLNKIRKADITHGWSTANTDSIQDYISSERFIRFRVMAKDESSTFNCLADYMRITVQYETQ